MDQTPTRVWCHICDGEQLATRESDTLEYFCNNCHENFVEELDQEGLQDFLSGAAGSPGESPNDDFPSPGVSSPPATSSNLGLESDSTLRTVDPQPARRTEVQRQSQNHPMVQAFIDSVDNSLIPQRVAPRQDTYSRPFGLVVRQVDISSPWGVFPGGVLGLLNAIAGARPYTYFYDDPNALSNADFERLLHHVLMNESSHAGVPPASEDTISRLHRVALSSETIESEKGECSISQEAFVEGDVVVTLPCGHRYKEEPIVHWLRMHSTCPVCRVNLTDEQPS